MIETYLQKKNIRESLWEVFGEVAIKTLTTLLKKDEISIESNEIGYIYSLIVSLKTYIDFLKSNEEKKDEYIIPALNSISKDKVNIVIFEKEDEQIKTKYTEHVDSDKYCLIIKEGHYYEPIVYRVNLLKIQYEIKVLSKNIFSSFEVFEKGIFNKFLISPYPRGRKGVDKLNCKDNAKHCSEWIPYEHVKKVKKGTSIRWITNNVEGCPNSGKKNYDVFEKETEGVIVTKSGIKVKVDNVYVKITKQVDPKLKAGLNDKTKWIWIDRDCGDIHDKDIESLIRKKYDISGDKLLLDLSKKTLTTIKKEEDSEILRAMESNFFLANRTITDLEKIKEENMIQYHEIENIGKEYYINNYSEITHIIYKTDTNDIIIPISPIKMTPFYKNINVVYDIKEYPKFKDVESYLKMLDINIDTVIINAQDEITCLFLKDGIIPIQKEIIKGYEQYNVIRSEINPFEVDKSIMSKKDLSKNYINNFKKENNNKHKLFTKLLNLIKDDETIELNLMGIIEDPVFIMKHKVEKVYNILRKKIVSKVDFYEFPELSKKSKKLIQEFSFKLIISVESGEKISTINKIIDTVVKYSDLEKNTPDTEVFIKYVRDKDIMNNYLRDIFIKKSNFINIINKTPYSSNHRIKTTKLKTTPYYINKLFGPDTSIVFNIDGNGGDWYNLSQALISIDIKPSHYANEIREIKGVIEGPKRKIKYIGHIQRIILYKLSELNDINLQEKRDTFIRSYNKYNLLRYGDKHKMFNTIDDIMKYWRRDSDEKENKQRINKPDIELILERVKEENIEDFGVLLISFSKGKEMDIKFYGTDNINENTKVALLHHTLYNNDYILSNILVGGKDYLTIKELYELSPLHKKWIKLNNNKEERLRELIERKDKLEEMIEVGIDDIKGYQEKLNKTDEEIQKLKIENQ